MIEVQASRAAQFRRAIVLCCDSNYMPYALAALAQIHALAPRRDFDLCLVGGDETLKVPTSLAYLDLRVVRVRAESLFDSLHLDSRRTLSTYMRLALPDVFSADYDRILYVDSDVFVQGGDFSALLSLDLRGHAIAAIRDNMQWRTPGRLVPQFRALGLKQAPYFNAGVLLIDVAIFNRMEILPRCLDLGRKKASRIRENDQGLLNSVLHGDWAELSPRWNWQYTWSSRLFETMADAHVVHFIGPRKPWNYTGSELPLRFRRAYEAFLAQHFPERPMPNETAADPAANAASLRRTLIKHLLSHRAMARYLSRFPDDLTVFG